MKRKVAARYLEMSPGTLSVYDCTKHVDLKPFKEGKYVYYWRSELDKFKDLKRRRIITPRKMR